jgi:subtilisin family serine protease
MKRNALSAGMVAMLSVALFLAQISISVAQPQNVGGRVIVVFQNHANNAAENNIIGNAGGVTLKDLDIIDAKAVWLPSQAAARALANNPAVLRVDEDIIVDAVGKGGGHGGGKPAPQPTPEPAQVLPWGIDRIDAQDVWPLDTADPVKVGIIDTGISNTHPDLVANIKGGINTISSGKSWNDDNGHGSHVAGIIAALNNTVGVIGAGPNADLYAIKALDRNGSGYLSDIIEGIQWAVVNHIQVINMSLGSDSDVQSFHDAVIAAKAAGIVIVAAAGNTGGSVIFPAAYPEVIAVSATDQNDHIASWSSRGPEVDLAAPGVNIYSTYKGTGYATLSGTSMAAPHVTGCVALVLASPISSYYDVNHNGRWDPDEVQNDLEDSAVDLGSVGFDPLYGAGLVNAYNAVVQP